MDVLLETGLACVVPPLVVLLVSGAGIMFLLLLDKKMEKD